MVNKVNLSVEDPSEKSHYVNTEVGYRFGTVIKSSVKVKDFCECLCMYGNVLMYVHKQVKKETSKKHHF